MNRLAGSFVRWRRAGFTMVELVVVIVIIGALATMIAPRLAGSMKARSLPESAHRLRTVTQYARDFAITHRRQCRLMLNSAENEYSLASQLDPEHRPGRFGPLTGVGRRRGLGDGLRFAKVWVEPLHWRAKGSSGDCITFDASGRGEAAIVQMTDGERTMSLLVAPSTARVKLVEGAVEELPNDRHDLDQ